MKILVLNGSPHKEKSNTIKITNAFVDGIRQAVDADITQVDIYDKNTEINHCIGCFNCWTKTPGKCIFNDSVKEILDEYIASDIVIWSFPLYYFGVPSKLKAFLDRNLPLNLPFMTKEQAGHVSRYDLSNQKTVVISTGGLSTVENNFEPLVEQFDRMSDNRGYEKILCAQGALLSVDALNSSIHPYLDTVKQAGEQYALQGSIPDELQKKIDIPFFPIDVYNKMADSSWDISSEKNESKNTLKYFSFTKQMAALYNKNNYDKDFVLEIEYTDVAEKYQIIIDKNGSDVIKENFKEYTTKIETPFSIWSDISAGKLLGSTALMEGKYKVLGDLSIMMNWDKYFGGTANHQNKESDVNYKPIIKKSNMNVMLIPWIVFWIFVHMSSPLNIIVPILTCTVTLFVFYNKYEFTIYDRLSSVMVTIISSLSMFSLFSGDNKIYLLIVSYLIFGFLWIGSVTLTKIPLSAHYSKVDFGGDKAYDNIIFMKTNKILTVCWGVFYILVSTSLFLTIGLQAQKYIIIANNFLPVAMGWFTLWFKNWYPKKLMSD